MNDCLYTKEWNLPSEYGHEISMLQEVTRVVAEFDPQMPYMEDMKTVISEAYLNAAEHGNQLDKGLYVTIKMHVTAQSYLFRIYDEGQGFAYQPPIAMLAESKMHEEDPRGWGLMLIATLAHRIDCGREEGRFYMQITFYRGQEGGSERTWS